MTNKTVGQVDKELNAAERKIQARLAFLKGYTSNLVPDPSEDVPIETRAERKKEKEEMDARIDELEKLMIEMRNN